MFSFNFELMVSVLWWLLLLHVFMTATEIVLTRANNLEDISNKKKEHFLLALVCLFSVNVNNRSFYSCVLSCQAFDLE